MWSLFFLAVLAVVVSTRVSAGLEAARRLRQRTGGDALVRAGAAWACAAVAGDTNGWDAEIEPWGAGDEALFRDVETGAGRFSVIGAYQPDTTPRYGLADEGRRLNLNAAALEVIRELIASAAGLDEVAAGEIAACIIDWKDEDTEAHEGGAEDDYYLARSPGYECRDGPLQSVEELLLVKGMTPAILERIAGLVTVYGGKVNVNTAEPQVLAALARAVAGAGSSAACDSLVSRLLRYRSSGRAFESIAQVAGDLNEFDAMGGEEGPILAGMTRMMGVSSRAFRAEVVATAEDGGATRRAVVVYDRIRERVEFWHED